MVTVAFSISSSCASGLPTILERPITTASSPASDPCTCLGEHDAGQRRARHDAGQPGRQQPGRQRMKAVDILGRRDGLDHLARVDLRRQRQLHQDAMHGRVLVQPLDQLQQLGFGRRRRQFVERRAHIGRGGLGGLAAHIDFARRIVADEHHGQPRLDAVLGGQRAWRRRRCFGSARPRWLCRR